MFLLFFPRTIVDLIIGETNKVLGTPMDIGEFLRFLGIILFIATQSSINRREYWSKRPVSVDYGAPYRFHNWMSGWLNKWTCPGWVFCPRKPHPFGNEYHTICCGLSGILFDMEMVEGKDQPKELKAKHKEEDKYGTTCGLLMRLCRTMFTTGNFF